ncbi:GNAT family N-acetyltransferase [uncultured Stenotrophomonas sp.]|uniref:GNAT family N-acetyltransferase n=1 Tax=uncultured Stenotrophomonas sp. TaxID=165438 RepID=UPI0025D7E2AE|nr:GNAT family N-acetyltransferase [uncultured Stenotrophomonas sp.]
MAQRDELALLPLIEAQAGERLRGHPAAKVFAASPTEPALFELAWQRGMLWVVASEQKLAGYLMAGALDENFHIQQMDVAPAHGRKGLGRALLRHALQQARASGYPRAVLTTLSDVAWNAPFYASEGFSEWPSHAWSAGMREVMAAEAAAGFPMELRLAMQRILS